MRRICVAMLVLALLAVPVVRAEPAAATLHPPGCKTVAAFTPSSSPWSGLCWVGYSYDLNGYYTVSIQRILEGYFAYSGPIDGIWGPNTYNGVVYYQQNRPGLTVDGVVGEQTFLRLRQDLTNESYLGLVNGIHHYGAGWNIWYVAFTNCPCIDQGHDQPFRVLHPWGGVYPLMSSSGP